MLILASKFAPEAQYDEEQTFFPSQFQPLKIKIYKKKFLDTVLLYRIEQSSCLKKIRPKCRYFDFKMLQSALMRNSLTERRLLSKVTYPERLYGVKIMNIRAIEYLTVNYTKCFLFHPNFCASISEYWAINSQNRKTNLTHSAWLSCPADTLLSHLTS
jgi:hypothetical protein